MTEHDPDRVRPSPDPSPLAPALRAGKAFLLPFLLSWMVTVVGSRRDIEWLYFAGLGGIGLSMIGLFLWLLRVR